jgi:uncharacterized protein
MKFLLLFFIFMVLLWQWRQARSPKVGQAARKSPQAPGAVSMVECAQCGLHLPAPDALQGAQSWYCCVAHRQVREP